MPQAGRFEAKLKYLHDLVLGNYSPERLEIIWHAYKKDKQYLFKKISEHDPGSPFIFFLPTPSHSTFSPTLPLGKIV